MTGKRIPRTTLIAYAAGDLGGTEAATVKAMLSRDPRASATVARYRLARRTLLADDGADPSPAASASARAIFRSAPGANLADRVVEVGRIIATIIFDSRVKPLAAGLRGPTTSFQMTWSLSGPEGLTGELDLAAEPVESDPDGSWRVVGQLATREPIPSLRVDVCRAGSLTPEQTTVGDRRGAFMLRLRPGTWDFHLHLPKTTVVVPDIRIV